jgi:prevent-host-death family protein
MANIAKPIAVPAAELTRNFGLWQDRTAQGPVFVTNHGRPRVVLLSMDDFARISGTAAAMVGAEATLADALDGHGGIIHARLTTEGRFANIGEDHARRLGFTAEQLCQMRFIDLLGLACRARARVLIDCVVRQGEVEAFDSQLLVEGIAERAVRIALAPIRGEGTIDGLMLVMTF